MRGKFAIGLLAFGLTGTATASASEIKVLSAGAFKSVVVAMLPDFEQRTGNKVIVENGTAGELAKRIEGGEAFDLVIAPSSVIGTLIEKGQVAVGSRHDLGRAGIGVMVKDGAPAPDVSSVDAFKKTILAAKTVAYIDPSSGGSSGVYLTALFDKLGLAADVKPKAKLKKGGYVGDLLVKGEAELGIHQISEILAVKGVTLVGPLPAEIQNYTVYSGGVSSAAKETAAAQALLTELTGAKAQGILRDKGMETP